MNEKDTFTPREDPDLDTIVVETAAAQSLNLLLPLLRITAKLADFAVTSSEAILLCDVLRDRNFLDEPPAYLAEAIARDLEDAEGAAERLRVDRFELGSSIRQLEAAEAYLLYAATVLFWAAHSRFPQVEVQDFFRIR